MGGTLNDVTQFVPKHFKANFGTEKIIPSGKDLKDGMKVLVMDDDHRVFIPGYTDGRSWKHEESALRWNRWSTVTKFDLFDDGKLISFIGVFDDGSKKQLIVDSGKAWYAKLDTIDQP